MWRASDAVKKEEEWLTRKVEIRHWMKQGQSEAPGRDVLYVKIFLLVCSVFLIQYLYHVMNKYV